MMDYNERYIELNNYFEQGKDMHIDKTRLDLHFFRFYNSSDEEESNTLQYAEKRMALVSNGIRGYEAINKDIILGKIKL